MIEVLWWHPGKSRAMGGRTWKRTFDASEDGQDKANGLLRRLRSRNMAYVTYLIVRIT